MPLSPKSGGQRRQLRRGFLPSALACPALVQSAALQHESALPRPSREDWRGTGMLIAVSHVCRSDHNERLCMCVHMRFATVVGCTLGFARTECALSDEPRHFQGLVAAMPLRKVLGGGAPARHDGCTLHSSQHPRSVSGRQRAMPITPLPYQRVLPIALLASIWRGTYRPHTGISGTRLWFSLGGTRNAACLQARLLGLR